MRQVVPAELQAMQLDESTNQQLMVYQALLIKWNKTYNLTASKQAGDILHRHILDSLSVMKFVQGKRCLDVGTGAGLPGMILAITDKNRDWTLLDSNVKKIRFLRHVKTELDLNNVEVSHVRVEEFVPKNPYDTIICRAFAPLDRMLSQLGYLLTNTNQLLAMKGKQVRQEVNDVNQDDLTIEVHHLETEAQTEGANLVQIRQSAND